MDTVEKKNLDETVKGDLMVNNLIYRQPKQLSLAVNRSMKRQYFQRSSYTASATAIIDWNTGSDYVKACNSYLTFKVALTGTDPVGGFGVGSAANLLQSIVIRSRSGTELDRLDRLNLWSKNDIAHTLGADWISKFGTMAGVRGLANALSDTAVRFVLPLTMLAGFFRPVGGQLIPPQLASGLHIELVFADYREAILQGSGSVTGFTITDISMMTDCVTLSDDTQKTLNFESASSGLEYTYPRIHTSTSTITSTAINAQISKAVSQANIATGCLLTQAAVLDVTADSLKSPAWNVSSWQYRIGSIYMPNQPLTDAGDGLESFFTAQAVYDKAKHHHMENAVSLTDFKTNGYGVMSVSMEKDQSLNLSGLPINNSRMLELQATLAAWSANLELVVFLEYTSVARAYIDNCVVSI